MAKLTIVYWRDIPAQVIVRKDRESAKRQLASRFQDAIDMAAMRANAADADAYLAEWRFGPEEECGDDLNAEAGGALARIEAAYDEARLEALVATGGRDSC